MTDNDRKYAIECIEGQLEYGYIDLGCHDKDELEIIKEAMSALKILEQIRWERDVAISQLKEIGLSLGQKVDGVTNKMKAVKKFNFPSFEEWFISRNYEQQIGSYTCRIHHFSSTLEKHKEIEQYYHFIIYTENEYYGKAISTYMWDKKNKDELKKWYEDSVKKVNTKWKKYIFETYFD